MVLSPFYREGYLVGGPHVSKFRSVEMCKYVSVYYIGTTKAELTRGYPLIGIPIKAIGVHELEVGGPGIMEHLRGPAALDRRNSQRERPTKGLEHRDNTTVASGHLPLESMKKSSKAQDKRSTAHSKTIRRNLLETDGKIRDLWLGNEKCSLK